MTPRFRRLIAPLFFISFFLLGLFITPDYGVGWDEARQRELGITVFDYINERLGFPFYEGHQMDVRLPELDNRDHGSLFQSIAYSIEYFFKIEDYRQHYLMRHYLSFLIFFFGTLCFYQLLKMQWKDSLPALGGTLLFLLQPRIFGHAFNNPKDTIFLAFFTIAMYALARFLQHKTLRRALLFGLACGALMNVRILAVLVPAILVGFVGLEWYKAKFSGRYLKKMGIPLTVYFVSFIAFMIALGPYLWEDTLGNLIFAFNSMSAYSWGGQMLYWHNWVYATERPWHYPISWIAITTPLFILLPFLYGSYCAFRQIIRKRFYDSFEGQLLLMSVVWFYGPLLAVIIKGSTLYDGWRHLFFVAPAMAMLALYGLQELYKKLDRPNWKNALNGTVAISVVYTLFLMVYHHPNQQIYFNWVPGTHITDRFEMDYYGASYKEALEQLAEQETKDTIRVYFANWPGRANYIYLEPKLKDRYRQVSEFDEADYFLSNYRYPHEWGKWIRNDHPYNDPVLELKFRGNPYLGVYKGVR